MNILIIGYGSIGKRHFEILNKFDEIKEINIVTKQELKDIVTFTELNEITNLVFYDYFIISSETVKHYEQLKYICSKVNNKKILVEKPLYDKTHDAINSNNEIFTAYNLRFHPVMQKLSNILKDEEIYYANIICGQYLPTWRPAKNYKLSYSASLKQGGGVLRDLSHELDYTAWLFGDIVKIDAINTKISDLEITSDDLFTAIAFTKKRAVVNITMDYISKTPIRRLIIHTADKTIEADVVNNTIVMHDKNANREEVSLGKIESNHSYSKMHEAILGNNYEKLCSFTHGKKIVKLINNIEFQELTNEKI